MRIRPVDEAVPVDPDAGTRGQFGAHLLVDQAHRIIAGMRHFAVMVEARPIPRPRLFGIARLQRHGLARHRHDQEIAQVRMPRTREMGVAEPLDRRVLVPIARGVRIAGTDDAGRVGIGTQLHHPERRGCAGESMPLPARPDHRIDGVVRAMAAACGIVWAASGVATNVARRRKRIRANRAACRDRVIVFDTTGLCWRRGNRRRGC